MFTSVTRSLFAAAVALIALFAWDGTARAAHTEQCPGATAVPTAAGTDEAADAIVCLVNAERTSRGLRALSRDQDLAQAADKHANDMVRRNYFAHVSPSGKSVGDRVRDAGYGNPGDGWKVGEDLGWGTGSRGTPAGLVDAWLASPPHKHIMLEAGYKELGVGVAAGAPLDHPTSLPGATYALDLGVIRPG